MDFEHSRRPGRLPRRARRLHRARDQAARGRPTTTSASSTTGARMPAPTGSAAACPNEEWEALLGEARAPGRRRRPLPLPVPEGVRRQGRHQPRAWRSSASTSPARASGLHNDLQNEHSIVGNNVGLLLMINYGTDEQKAEWIDDLAEGAAGFAFGITEPDHGSDATHMETTAVRDGDEWVINGEKTWNTGIHKAPVRPDLRPHERQGRRRRAASPRSSCRPTARASRSSSSCGRSTCRPTTPTSGSPTCGCRTARSSAARAGACRWCSTSSTRTASARRRRASARPQFCIERGGRVRQGAHAVRQAARHATRRIQFPLVELQTQCEMLRALIHKTAWGMDTYGAFSVSDKVSMCNYWSNRLCCEAADRAMQVHGGLGYSRHKPFEHIYRHHRRYRITEGSRGDPDAPRRRLHVRLHEAARPEGRRRLTDGAARPSRRSGIGRPPGSLDAHASAAAVTSGCPATRGSADTRRVRARARGG